MCGFDVVANPATLQKVPDVPAGLAGTGARLVEASCRQVPDVVCIIHCSRQWSHTQPACRRPPAVVRVTHKANVQHSTLAAALTRRVSNYQRQVCHAGQRPQTC